MIGGVCTSPSSSCPENSRFLLFLSALPFRITPCAKNLSRCRRRGRRIPRCGRVARCRRVSWCRRISRRWRVVRGRRISRRRRVVRGGWRIRGLSIGYRYLNHASALIDCSSEIIHCDRARCLIQPIPLRRLYLNELIIIPDCIVDDRLPICIRYQISITSVRLTA